MEVIANHEIRAALEIHRRTMDPGVPLDLMPYR
jgi:hypothetical protein